MKSPSGIVAIAGRKGATAAEICARPDAFILAAMDVQEPGNVGALLRAAEAGGVTGAFVCGASANPFSWKALRGSMGSVLRLPVVARHDHASGDDGDAASRACALVAAVPRGGQDPDAIDWRGKVGLLLGGEGPGLTDEAIACCDARVTIPMAGSVESLNVAAAGAILVYAARRRQRIMSGALFDDDGIAEAGLQTRLGQRRPRPARRSRNACVRARSTRSSVRRRSSRQASRCARRSSAISCSRSSSGVRQAPARRRWRG